MHFIYICRDQVGIDCAKQDARENLVISTLQYNDVMREPIKIVGNFNFVGVSNLKKQNQFSISGEVIILQQEVPVRRLVHPKPESF